MHVIPALRKLRQEIYEFEANLSYKARPCLKNTTATVKEKKLNMINY
jgi:hypothetical protein